MLKLVFLRVHGVVLALGMCGILYLVTLSVCLADGEYRQDGT